MNSKYIAAIEIGSSRTKGIVAAVEPDGRIKTLAVEEADSGDSVRYGRVQNAREASAIVNDIVRRLENNPQVAPGRISTLFIANGGRSLLSSPSEASLNFGTEEEISRHTLERLNKEARFNLGTDRDILAIAPKRFFVNASEAKKIVGMFGNTVRGEFTVVTQAPENRRALDRVIIESHGREVQRDYVTRLLAQTEMALTESDRQVGSLFIDFGAETTSLAAFRDGSLLFAATLPIGSANITRDLSSALSVTLDKAKNIKHTKGVAVVDRNKLETSDAESREIINYVSTRAGEIVANVNNLLDLAGFRPTDFPGGIVITGGGTRLKGFPEMVESLTKMKVRMAAVDTSVASASPSINPADHFDVISIARYAANHSDIDCLSFPEEDEVTAEAPATISGAAAGEIKIDTPASTRAAGTRRAEIPKEDDADLLKDEDQPDNVNSDELPEPEKDPNKTRKKLAERLKKIREFMAPPITMIDNDDMD